MDYQIIKKVRQIDETENFDYFIRELVKIPEVMDKIVSILEEKGNE